jgi:hypothetical protein
MYGQDAVYVSVMHASNSDPPSQSAVAQWASQYSVNHPVLADALGSSYSMINGGYPSYVLIDQNMTIHIEDLYPFNPNTAASLISNR